MFALNTDIIANILLNLSIEDIRNIAGNIISFTIMNEILKNTQFWSKKIDREFELTYFGQHDIKWYCDFYAILLHSTSMFTTLDNLIKANNVDYFKPILLKRSLETEILTDALKSAVSKGATIFVKILIKDGRANINEFINVAVDAVPMVVIAANTVSIKYFLKDIRLNLSNNIGLDILDNLIRNTNLKNFKLVFEDKRLDLTTSINNLNILMTSATNRDIPLSYEQHMSRLARGNISANNEKIIKCAKYMAERDKFLNRNNSIEIFKLIVKDTRFIKLIDNNLADILEKRLDKDKLKIVRDRIEEIQNI
jgi:hypothetical protein